MLTYLVDYLAPGRRPVTTSYTTERPPARGQWITVDGVHLVVERVRKADPANGAHDGIAFCRVARQR